MKKQKVLRKYAFSDARLIVKGMEKISFLRRDIAVIAMFGITETMITELEASLTNFSQDITDIEAKNAQLAVSQAKYAKAEELRSAIRNVIRRVEFVFGRNTARYRQFDPNGLNAKTNMELVITAKVVVRAGSKHLQELQETGLTIGMLSAILVLCEDFEELIYMQKDIIWERNSMKENRIIQGNSIYATLIKYTAIGFEIWETISAAKYNDYIIYDRASKN